MKTSVRYEYEHTHTHTHTHTDTNNIDEHYKSTLQMGKSVLMQGPG